MKVLVVEDDLAYSENYLLPALEEAGFKCDHVRELAEALRLMYSNVYDLIVLDRFILLGERLGIETEPLDAGEQFLKEIKGRITTEKVPIVVHSQFQIDETIKQILGDPSVRYVNKIEGVEVLVDVCTSLVAEFPLTDVAKSRAYFEPDDPILVSYNAVCRIKNEFIPVAFSYIDLGRVEIDASVCESRELLDSRHNAVSALWCENFDRFADVLGYFSCYVPADEDDGDRSTSWLRDIWFGVREEFRADQAERSISGLGTVMVARAIREYMRQNKISISKVRTGSESLEGFYLRSSQKNEFLTKLGFQYDERSRSFSLTKSVAVGILLQVCPP